MTSGRRATPRVRLRRLLTEAGAVILGIVLLIWTVIPVYNMLLIALDPEEGEIEFTGNLWPPEPSLEGFIDVVTPEQLGVDAAPRLVTLKVEEPAKRQGGIKVGSVAELIEKLKSEARVI